MAVHSFQCTLHTFTSSKGFPFLPVGWFYHGSLQQNTVFLCNCEVRNEGVFDILWWVDEGGVQLFHTRFNHTWWRNSQMVGWSALSYARDSYVSTQSWKLFFFFLKVLLLARTNSPFVSISIYPPILPALLVSASTPMVGWRECSDVLLGSSRVDTHAAREPSEGYDEGGKLLQGDSKDSMVFGLSDGDSHFLGGGGLH